MAQGGVPIPQDSTLGSLARLAGNGISKFFGLGAYTLEKNSLYDNKTGSQVPFMHSTNESITFRHREYLGDISSSTNFTTSKFPINPGLERSFPYLSTLANNFQEYQFDGLVFEFKSTGATSLVSGTNTALGSIQLVANYNANDIAPDNKVEALNSMWSVSSKTSEDCCLPVECAPGQTSVVNKYVRSGGITGDLRLNDLCNVFVCTSGSQAANVVGELWISYEVKLMKPSTSPSGGLIRTDHYHQYGIYGTELYGSLVTTRLSEIGTAAGQNTLTFPVGTVGYYLVNVYIKGNAIPPASSGQVALFPTNCTIAAHYNTAGQDKGEAPDSGGLVGDIQTVVNFVVFIQDPAVVATVVSTVPPLPAAAQIDVLVTEVSAQYGVAAN